MTDPTPREVETACHCPGGPHQRDHFVLPAELPIPAGVAAVTVVSEWQRNGGAGDIAAALINAILVNGGIASWNLVDQEGDPVRITPTNVMARVTWAKGGVELSNAAFAHWINGKDLTPFGLGTSKQKKRKSSPGGRTATSTSAKTPSSPEPQEPTE